MLNTGSYYCLLYYTYVYKLANDRYGLLSFENIGHYIQKKKPDVGSFIHKLIHGLPSRKH